MVSRSKGYAGFILSSGRIANEVKQEGDPNVIDKLNAELTECLAGCFPQKTSNQPNLLDIGEKADDMRVDDPPDSKLILNVHLIINNKDARTNAISHRRKNQTKHELKDKCYYLASVRIGWIEDQLLCRYSNDRSSSLYPCRSSPNCSKIENVGETILLFGATRKSWTFFVVRKILIPNNKLSDLDRKPIVDACQKVSKISIVLGVAWSTINSVI
ncbi:hypothetical protein RF11_02531 [Thelohanellus kitauei]|uniref:Uncharacterized protein n=1 Tax=Thelohanellus kitauei TaxID=669202 RepID=A0A0C2M7J9_THEKT|nr:hypothetical protein RF11_02531 [Thelohanellus kitauei]